MKPQNTKTTLQMGQ